MDIVTLDFETFWDTDYTLSRISPLEYVMDDRFELISCAIKVNNARTRIVFGANVAKALALTADIPALDALRAQVRPRFEASPLRDEAGFTATFAALLDYVREHGEVLGDDELDQDDTDGIVDTLESLEEDLSDEVSGIDFRTAREVATAVEDDLEDVTTEVLAAWLFRAGQLV